jgi:hypothetical protein
MGWFQNAFTRRINVRNKPKKENGRVGRAPLIEAFDVAVE